MSEDERTPGDQPPRIVLYVLYALFAATLLAVLVIGGVYGAKNEYTSLRG